MSTDLFRNYIDLINEASEQQQLDEGIGDWLQSKVSGLLDKFLASSPKAQQAYKQAQSRKNELINILKTSKSAEEAKSIIDNSGLNVHSAVTLKDAADKVKELVN